MSEEEQNLEAVKKIVMRNILSKEASERMSRLKLVKPDLAAQLELYLMQLYKGGKIKSQVTDEQLKVILETLSNKKEFKLIK